MPLRESGTEWRVVGRSVRGASHVRGGLPNQDAIGWWSGAGDGLPLILAVADGHGSAKYFRSDAGALLAVETAVGVLRAFVEGHSDVDNLSLLKRTAEEWLPKTLVRGWREAVEAHILEHPLKAHELSLTMRGPGAFDPTHVDMPRSYGATLVAVAVARSFVLYVQLGDGDILSVSDEGEVTPPLPPDERLFANETTSLCAAEAWRDFRVGFRPISTTPPALIMLSTDGYANSFRDETAFRQVGPDLLSIVREKGLARVEADLESWLTESTYSGSGDDVTLGLICRMSAGGQMQAAEATASESVESMHGRGVSAGAHIRDGAEAQADGVEAGEGVLCEPDA